MIRTERYKLVHFSGLGMGELYDLQEDSRERNNLWNNPTYQGLQLEMFMRLTDAEAQTLDPLPVREGPW
jgi:hypothetical protein